MTTVKIAGAEVDCEDPCALYQALYAYKLKILSGGAVEEVEVRSPITHQRTKFGASNIDALDAELSRLQTACEAKRGRRRRFAIRGVHRRPY